jgi:hypothetical protein
MSRFEREKISKRVLTVSQVFATLAGVGILIIGLQLFSKTTGLDLFNIQYSLSNLFSDAPSKPKLSETATERYNSFTESNSTLPLDPSLSAETKAETFLRNMVTVSPIKPAENIADEEDNRPSKKYTPIDISSLLTSGELFRSTTQTIYSKNLNQNGILPVVKNAKYSRWSIGLSLTPGVSFTRLKYTHLSEISTGRVGNTQYGFYQTQKERNEMNKSLMKYSLGLEINCRLNHRWSLQSGLVYLNSGESVLVKEIQDENNARLTTTQNLDNNFFEGQPDFESPKETNSETNVRFANNLSFFEIPLILVYRVNTINKLTDIEIQGGISATKLDYVTSMVYNFENDGYYLITGSQPSVYQKYGSNAICGISMSKYITNTIQFFANPQLKVGLTNIFNSEYNIKQHYLNAGVRLGMKINL